MNEGNPHHQSKALFWQHYFVHKGTFTRAYKIAEQIASPDLEIWVCGVDPQSKGFLPTITPGTKNPHVMIVGFPGQMGESNSPAQIARRVLAAWIWAVFQAPRFEIGHFFALGHPFNALTAPLLAFLKCRRRFVDWDDLWGGGFASFMGRGMNGFLTVCERHLPRILRPEKVTTVSGYLAEQFAQIGFPVDRIHLIGNGFDEKDFAESHVTSPVLRKKLRLSDDSVIAVSVGNTYSPESLRNLLEAFAMASRENDRLHLVLLGQFRKFGELGRQLDEVMAQFAHLVGKKVFELGAVPLDVMHGFLRECDFVILPMEDHPIDRARFPIRLGDYLQHKKLIVSNAVGEVRKILNGKRLGLLAPANEPEQFAQAILRGAIEFRDYSENHDSEFKDLLKEYSWKSLALRWIKLYYN